MANPTIKIHDIETGSDIERPMNADEFAQDKIDQAAVMAMNAEKEKKADQQKALLEKLGITAEEAKLLLG